VAITQKQLTSNVIDNPCRSSFSHNKQIFTVEMIDPVITKLGDGTYAIPNALYLGDPERGVLGSQMLDGAITLGEPELPTWGVKHTKINAKNKTQVITGLFVPATFRVIGFKYQITFTTFQDKSNERGIGIKSMTVETKDDSIRREILAKIITDKILNASIQASSFAARYTDQDSIIKNLKIHKLGNKLNVKQVDKWRGKRRRGRGTQQDLSCSNTNIDRFVKLWHECPTGHVGGKDGYIATHMCHPDGTPLFESAQRARQLRHARDLKRIPDSKRSKPKQNKRGNK
jgi:hypothetical protein